MNFGGNNLFGGHGVGLMASLMGRINTAQMQGGGMLQQNPLMGQQPMQQQAQPGTAGMPMQQGPQGQNDPAMIGAHQGVNNAPVGNFGGFGRFNGFGGFGGGGFQPGSFQPTPSQGFSGMGRPGWSNFGGYNPNMGIMRY